MNLHSHSGIPALEDGEATSPQAPIPTAPAKPHVGEPTVVPSFRHAAAPTIPLSELVVLSGKGGTGKTSVTASLAALAQPLVLADGDVDASNLPLVLNPQPRQRRPFAGGLRARIKPGHCTACGKCEELCRFDAIFFDGPGNGRVPRTFRVEPSACEGCGVCHHFCAELAIELLPADSGECLVSDTPYGPLVHARLRPGEGNSGKLVTLVREQARQIAAASGHQLVLIDGPPGIGCPVIASLTGATRMLVVTEPTPSGEHDLERVLALGRHFQIPAWVCVNKHDLNPALTTRLEQHATELGAVVLGRIPYDPAVTAAQRQGRPLVEANHSPAAEAITGLWERIRTALRTNAGPLPATRGILKEKETNL